MRLPPSRDASCFQRLSNETRDGKGEVLSLRVIRTLGREKREWQIYGKLTRGTRDLSFFLSAGLACSLLPGRACGGR